MVLTRTDLVRLIGGKIGFQAADVKTIIDQALIIMQEFLEHGRPVEFRGFGSFKVVVRKGRTYQNPKTGEKIKVPDRTKVVFNQHWERQEFKPTPPRVPMARMVEPDEPDDDDVDSDEGGEG